MSNRNDYSGNYRNRYEDESQGQDRNARQRNDGLYYNDPGDNNYNRFNRQYNDDGFFGPDEKYNRESLNNQYSRGHQSYNQPNYGDRYYEGGYVQNTNQGRYSQGEMANPIDQQGYSGYNSGNATSHRGKGPKGYTRSDERIKEDVNDRLYDNHSLDASDIEVAVNNGEVTLTGTVNSKRDKRYAEDICEAVSGVKDVHNQLKVAAGNSEYYDIGTGAVSTGAMDVTYGSSGAAPVGAFELHKN